MTKNVRAVLRSFLDAVGHVRFGYEVMQETGLTSGTVYPILHRLEDAGLVTSEEEPSPAKGKPPRRCYRLTQLGLAEARKPD